MGLSCRVPRLVLGSPQGVLGAPGIGNDQLQRLCLLLLLLRSQAWIPERQLLVEHRPCGGFHGPFGAHTSSPAGQPPPLSPGLACAGRWVGVGRWKQPRGKVVWNLEQVWAERRARAAASDCPIRAWGLGALGAGGSGGRAARRGGRSPASGRHRRPETRPGPPWPPELRGSPLDPSARWGRSVVWVRLSMRLGTGVGSQGLLWEGPAGWDSLGCHRGAPVQQVALQASWGPKRCPGSHCGHTGVGRGGGPLLPTHLC